MIDVAIVGGGPAGLSAALVLGRARRSVVLFDAGTPRNAAADRMWGYLGRDGTPPREFRRIARQELATYDSVAVHDARVTAIDHAGFAFQVHAQAGAFMVRRVIIAAGLVDEVPDMQRPLWGKRILQCPYCHGYEIRDRAYCFLARGDRDIDHALLLRAWTKDVVLLTEGHCELSAIRREQLDKAGIRVDDRPVRGIRESGDRVELDVEGGTIACDAVFTHCSQRHPDLVRDLKLATDAHGNLVVDAHMETSVPGIHAAGDLVSSSHTAIVAAGSGATAAYMVNIAVTLERAVQGDL